MHLFNMKGICKHSQNDIFLNYNCTLKYVNLISLFRTPKQCNCMKHPSKLKNYKKKLGDFGNEQDSHSSLSQTLYDDTRPDLCVRGMIRFFQVKCDYLQVTNQNTSRLNKISLLLQSSGENPSRTTHGQNRKAVKR